eukprot:13244567-Ditylum_brightwellii.AAC.1
MSAFNERLYKAIHNGIWGYRNRRAANFLHHLYGNYGQITSTMITESDTNMAKPFDPAAPIEDLFAQISNRQDLAVAAGVPYLEMQLVMKTYDLIFKTGVYNDACKEWNRRAAADKMYANLQLDFTQTHQ